MVTGCTVCPVLETHAGSCELLLLPLLAGAAGARSMAQRGVWQSMQWAVARVIYHIRRMIQPLGADFPLLLVYL